MAAEIRDRFPDDARRAIHDVIVRRRDIRHFRPGAPVPDDVLARILGAAHHAPSVGYSQPWDFVVVRDPARRARLRASFLRCRRAEASRFLPERREQYLAYRLEGIVEAALNLCVTVDLRPADEFVLGTLAQPEALRWSACCAVQNLWLAARAEGVGVGWVSIVEPQVLRDELALPAGVEPVAYLCVGIPVEFPDRPMLEGTGWKARRSLEDAIHCEAFGPASPPPRAAASPPDLPRERDAGGWPSIPRYDAAARDAAAARQLNLVKPAGSLGRLEELATWYAGARGAAAVPPPRRTELVVFAADHGVAAEGVSAFSSSTTATMLACVVAGEAAVSALARHAGVTVSAVDVGVAGDTTAVTRLLRERAADPTGDDVGSRGDVGFVSARVRAGTRNLRRGPAMTRAEALAALTVGLDAAARAARDGTELLLAGEIGIGNTTAAAALTAAFTGAAVDDVVGGGTGIDEEVRRRKVEVVTDALARRTRSGDALDVLAELGGLEIAAMTGLMLGGAAARLPVVIDGFISGAAALAAVALRPAVRDYLLVAHASAEAGQRAVCRHLGAIPLLDLGMRLGEGTGAVLAAWLVGAAVRAQHEMARFSTATTLRKRIE